MSGRFVRLGAQQRAAITLHVDGIAIAALAGDTVLTALLTQRAALRHAEFGAGEARAGFCAMGACQDCWIWREDGTRLRACTTLATDGLRLSLAAKDRTWLANG
jgi:D-hydroxyproline dehydrogenase subunit gamma